MTEERNILEAIFSSFEMLVYNSRKNVKEEQMV